MRRLSMVIVMALCLFSLAGFSYNKDKGRAFRPDTTSYNPLCISFMKTVMKEVKSPSTIFSSELIHFLLQPGEGMRDAWSPMEALDMVKQRYASNFEPVTIDIKTEDYYYKLKDVDYYLVYEGVVEEYYYLYHLYEFVLDEPDTGVGHTVTYGWYWVDKKTGMVIEQGL